MTGYILLTYIFTNFYPSFTVCHVNSCDLSNRILDNKKKHNGLTELLYSTGESLTSPTKPEIIVGLLVFAFNSSPDKVKAKGS